MLNLSLTLMNENECEMNENEPKCYGYKRTNQEKCGQLSQPPHFVYCVYFSECGGARLFDV